MEKIQAHSVRRYLAFLLALGMTLGMVPAYADEGGENPLSLAVTAPAEGPYTVGQGVTVSVTAPGGATVYYTADDTTPTTDSSTVSDDTIVVTAEEAKTITINALAVVPPAQEGEEETNYTASLEVTFEAEVEKSNNAELSTVLEQSISPEGTGTSSDSPKTATINVENAVEEVTKNDVAEADSNATIYFYGTDNSFQTENTDGVTLTAGEDTTVYIKVVAEDDTTLFYAVTVNRAVVVTVTGVTVSPAEVTVGKGKTQGFTAEVAGENEPSQEASWSVSGNLSDSTTISEAGVLTVAAKETAETLTVTATSTVDMNFSGTATVTVIDPSQQAVTINDSGLKALILTALSADSEHIITVGDMETLTTLDASDQGITDLTGLEAAVNLTTLDLSDNSLTVLTTLWSLTNLEELNLSGNALTADVTSTDEFHDLFTGIEALTKLKKLNLSHCDLGINPSLSSNVAIPTSLTYVGVNFLTGLEELDLSGNSLKGWFQFNAATTALLGLKVIDLSDNELKSVILSADIFTRLESIDISDNYIYFNETEDFYTSVVGMGADKYTHDSMKNLSALYSVAVTNAGVTNTYYPEEDSVEIDAGTLMGNFFYFTCQGFSTADTMKVTVDGVQYTAGSLTTEGDTISLSGLELGTEHVLTLTVMHMNGETSEYTLKFKTTPLPTGTAGICDANLQSAICGLLGKDSGTYAVTIEDMATLTGTLTLKYVSDMEGLQYATNITKLNLQNNTVSKVVDLSNLTELTSLQISGPFTSVPGVESLTNLTILSLTGSYDALPDLSGMTKLTQLRINSPNITALPTLPLSLKYLYLTDTESLPSLSGIAGLGLLQKLYLDNVSGLSLADAFTGCDKLTYLSVKNSTGVDLTGLESSKITVLYIESAEAFTLPRGATGLKKLTIQNCGLTELPEAVGDMTSLTTLSLSYNAMKDIPQAVTSLPALTSLIMPFNDMSVIHTDLSGMTQLKTLSMVECGLTEFPESLLRMENPALTSLDLSHNKIRWIDGSLGNLTNLTSLNLGGNRLLDFPVGILDLPALKTLDIATNLIADLPQGLAAALEDTLTSFNFGGRFRFGNDYNSIDGSTIAYQEVAALQNANVSVGFFQSYDPDTLLLSELRTLETSTDEFAIHENYIQAANQTYTMGLAAGTTSITLTPTAIYDATVITVNGTSVKSGESIVVPLSEGLNSVKVVCFYDYIPSFMTTFATTTTYDLTLRVGSGVGEDFPEEGKTYSIDMRVLQANKDSYSMADAHFAHVAEFTYDGELQRFAFDVTVSNYAWIKSMEYMDASGSYVQAERISVDKAANTAVYRMYLSQLQEFLYVRPDVAPMGYAPTCRFQFDTESIMNYTSQQSILSLDTQDAALILGSEQYQSQTATATLQNGDGYTIEWTSSDTAVATVAEGDDNTATITAASVGTCTITVTASKSGKSDLTKTISVRVGESTATPIQVGSVEVNSGTASATLSGDMLVTNNQTDNGASLGGDAITINAVNGGSGITAANVTIPAATLDALAVFGAESSVTLQTDVGDVTLSGAALAQAQSLRGTVVLAVSQASTPTGIGEYTDAFILTLTDGSGNTVVFSDGTATVSVPCDEDDDIHYAYCIANGAQTERQPVTVSGGMASWSTKHFSTWALSANEYEISGSNPGSGDEFFLTDGNYYVDIDLWKASANEESMGNVGFANNDRALVTVENGKITTVQVATNPVDVGEYHSAIITFKVIGSTVSVQETGSMTTQPAGKTYDYIKRVSFAMPDDGQPDIASAITYIDVQFYVPDTPMDAAVGDTLEARLRFKWSSAEATSDTTLKSDDSTAKGTSSITGTTIADIKLTDADTGIILTTDTDHVDDSGKFSVTKITSGNDYENTVKAMTSITEPWLLYKIVVNVDGVETAPKGSVKLSFPCDEEGLTIYRISDSGTKTVLKGKVEKGYYVLDTSTLGLFAIVGELSAVTMKEDLKDTATGIQLISLKDVLPDGAVLKVTAMNDGTGYTAAQTALKDKAEQFKLYAISTQTSAGAAIAPTDEVSLYFPIPDGYTSSLVEIYRITDDGKATRISGSVQDGYYVISTSDLGTFALVQRSASVLDQFTDIPETHWAKSYIETAVKSGLFSGTSKTEFNPEGEMSRAMMFTVFYNLSGDKRAGTGEFWYSTAMDWAKENGISDGNNPNGSITREQLVTMLYRYTGSKQASGDLSSYKDANMVSAYAVEAMKWAVSQGIVAGTTDGQLNPDQTAKRAEVATILVRYMEKK